MSESDTTSKTDSTTFPGKVALTHVLGSFRDALLGQKSQPAPTILQRKLSTGGFESRDSPIKNAKITSHREEIQSSPKYPTSFPSSTYSPKTDTPFPVAQNMSVEELLDSTVLRPKSMSSQPTLSPPQYHGDVLTPSALYKISKEERQRRIVGTKSTSDRKMPTVGVSISDFNRVKNELDKERKINVEKGREIESLKSDLEDERRELRENTTRLKAEMKIVREECEAEIKYVREKCEADMKALTDRFEAERKSREQEFKIEIEALRQRHEADMKALNDRFEAEGKSWREQSESEKKLLEERLGAENKSLREQSEADKKLFEEKSGTEIKSIRDQLEESKRQLDTLTSQLEQKDRTISEMKSVKGIGEVVRDIKNVEIADQKNISQTNSDVITTRSDVQSLPDVKERSVSIAPPVAVPISSAGSQENCIIEISLPALRSQYTAPTLMIPQYVSHSAPVPSLPDVKMITPDRIPADPVHITDRKHIPLYIDIPGNPCNPNHDANTYPEGIKYTLKYGGRYEKMWPDSIEKAYLYFLFGEGSYKYTLEGVSVTLTVTGEQIIEGYKTDNPRAMALARAAYSTHLLGEKDTPENAQRYLPGKVRCVNTHERIFGSLDTFCTFMGLRLDVNYSSLTISRRRVG